MQVPNRKTDRYDLLPARIFNSEAEAREFARRVNGHITGIRPVMHESYQDFNRVEPYAVCLAGKPVKKFDYYEDARRFHDNWKKKLYREGNKEKADKITLMPLNLDEAMNKNDLLGNVAKDLNPQFKKAKSGKLKASGDFTKGDHWKGAKPGDYGYTGYQGHGMPTDKAERDRIRADKKKGVAEGATVAYIVTVVDPETYEKKKLNISALTKEHAKEKAESKGYKVLRVDSEQGVAEGQLNEYFVRSGDDIASVFSLNLFKDLLGDTSLSNHDEEFANSPEWQAVVATWAPKAEHIQKEIYKYQNIGRKLRDAEADAIDATVYDGRDAYENAETAASYLPKVYNKQASAIVRLLKDGFANPPEGMHEDDGRVTSDGPIRLPTSPTIEPNSDYWTTEWPKEVRRKKQELLKDFSQNAKLVEIEWAFKHKAFMSKEQILDYLDQTINDPDLTPLEYMHNNGYSTDSMLKGMLKWLFALGLSQADIFGIIRSARRGNTDVSPAMISRVARQALRTEMTEDQSFVPAVGDEIMWRPKNAKMVPTLVTVVATTPDKLKIKLQSPGMIQRAGKDTIVVGINNSDIFPKQGVAEAGSPAQQAAIAIAMKRAGKKPKSVNEAINLTESRTYRLWESAGRKIMEAQLTTAQIQQLFQQAEQGANAAGSNRTMIGKGKDAATAVNQAWEQLKTKVQNSGPIKNVDAAYDQAAEKLKQATGGDAGVMQYVEKYRAFAKAHPIAQSLIYAALIAAAGISGAGVGGAAALGLLKMTDKLLQGEKFSSAAYSGAKTGATAYAAGQIGKALQGGDQTAQAGQQAASGLGRTALSTFQNDPTYGKQLATIIGDKQINPGWMQEFTKQLGRQVADPGDPRSMSQAWTNASRIANSIAGNPYGALGSLKESQIKRIFYTAAGLQTQLNEGMWDSIKGAAGNAVGAIANKAKTIGTNLTTKVTADTLMSAWKSAGSPTDSEAVADVMRKAGVDEQIINSVLATVANAPNTTTAKTHTGGRVAGQLSQTPNAIRQRQARAAQKQPATGGAGAFGQMAQQVTATTPTPTPQISSTGGTIQRTATGLTHTANPTNPNAKKKEQGMAETTAFLAQGPRLSYGDQAEHATLGPVQVERHMPDGSVVVHCERDGKKYRTSPSSLKLSVAEDQDTSGVESAIIRRIMVAHTDLLKQFGPEKVMQAAEEVAYNVGDVDEIGTSDISAYVNQVKQILGAE